MRGLLLLLLALAGCEQDIEGDLPGECEDGADNDADAAFDCLDPDCAGAPSCADEPADDTDPPEDTEVDPPDIQQVCELPGWDPEDGNRPPGPHAYEEGLVTAWLIDVSSYTRIFSDECTDTADPDWQPLFDLGAQAPDPDPDKYNYVFYQVRQACDTARKYSCTGSACFPDCCSPDELSYTRDEHTWTGDAESIEEGVDALLVPGCTLQVEQTPIIEDEGETARLTYRRVFTVGASCPAALQKNADCVVDFSYAMNWVKAE